ncbi:hypothetical protein GCM10009682_01250 [Luedemannella flava]|uniref:Uncharacterized protein n=1 Tax=Luedemannella flava TaxID=349316 RepID=A0ABP4XHC7_9ACTN
MARHLRKALTVLTVALIGVVALPPGTAAQAGTAVVLTAMQRCQQGGAPDVVEYTNHWGGMVGAGFPNVTEPDNEILPGDVVRVTVTGTMTYDSSGTGVGPYGIGLVAPSTWPFPGLYEYSSVARWNNKPGGWVGSPMMTGTLSSCTAAPTGYPVRLLYYVNDPNYADNSGAWTIRTEVFRAPGRVTIEKLEVTQGVQTPDAAVPMIAYKRTFVRAYVKGFDDGLGPLSGVTATLTVEGQTGVTYPLVNTTITASFTGSDRQSLTNSFLFELPRPFTNAGSRRITVTVIPPASRGGGWQSVRSRPVAFGPNGAPVVINLTAARIGWTNIPPAMQAQVGLTGPVWPARRASVWYQQRATAENALPISSLNINDLTWVDQAYALFDCKAVLGADGRWSCPGYLDVRSWTEAKVDALCPNGGCWLAVMLPELDDGHHGNHKTTSKGNHAITLLGERVPSEQGLTLAHEIGHGLGQAHTWLNADYPRADGGLGPYVGLRYSPTYSLVSGQDTTGRTTAYDVMSYDSPAWTSPYSYCRMLPIATGNRLNCWYIPR